MRTTRRRILIAATAALAAGAGLARAGEEAAKGAPGVVGTRPYLVGIGDHAGRAHGSSVRVGSDPRWWARARVRAECRALLPAPEDRFVVHEWGTFTSVHGSDGVALEGLTREEESLPSFVCDRTAVRDCPLRAQGWKGLEVPADRVTREMETPVIYFHSATD